MYAVSADASVTQVREVITRLQAPVPDLVLLLSLLSAPLECLNLLPPQYRAYNTLSIPSEAFNAARHLAPIQCAILEHVIPNWQPTFLEKQLTPLVDQYFVPDIFSYSSHSAGVVVIYAYSTLLSLPFSSYSLDCLARLSKAYPIDRLHSAIYSAPSSKVELDWEETVRNVLSVPPKVANALSGKDSIPPELDQGTYYSNVCSRTEVLLHTLTASDRKSSTSPIIYLFTRLVNIGAFPPSPPVAPSQPSFFFSVFPTIRSRLHGADATSYSAYWADLLSSFSSSLTARSILISIFGHIASIQPALDPSARSRALVKREASLILGLVGALHPNNELWPSIAALILGREWPEGHARVFACWSALSQRDSSLHQSSGALLKKTVEVWSSTDHIKHSLLSRHHYMTLLLLSAASDVPDNSPVLTELSLHTPFIRCIGTYIGHLDPSVRRCGMLIAEEVARRVGKSLDFGDWEGNDGGKVWAREVRTLIMSRDSDAQSIVDELEETAVLPVEDLLDMNQIEATSTKEAVSLPVAEGYDSDDSLTGYASPPSSRSQSPTPSELDEYEKDPTVRLGRNKITRPVYLAQLGELIRNMGGMKSEQENQEADKIEMGLNTAEELIRRKRYFGTELEENAVNLTYGFIALNNNYELDEFDHKRQGALNALVACCPRKTAPAVIGEFFKNQYSTDQRYVMLNALALGARELAGLPLPETAAIRPLNSDRITFPSKRLPPALHDRYTRSDATAQLQGVLTSISRQSIDNVKDATEQKAPELIRERRLRMNQPAKVAETQRPTPSQIAQAIRSSHLEQPRTMTFTDVAVDTFIYPLISRFWLFLRDEQTREDRTAQRQGPHQYRGAGTGLILGSVVLSHFLATLAILVHAAKNSPEWLAVVAPDALELAITLGTRPVSSAPDEDYDSEVEDVGNISGQRHEEKEAKVLVMALELALIVLDGCADLDGGRSLGLEHTALLLGAGEWASQVFSRFEKGLLVKGGGGLAEARLSKAAAGVVLKANELAERWRRSMVDLAR